MADTNSFAQTLQVWPSGGSSNKVRSLDLCQILSPRVTMSELINVAI